MLLSDQSWFVCKILSRTVAKLFDAMICWLGLGLRLVLARSLWVLFDQVSWLLGYDGTEFSSAPGSDLFDPRVLIDSYIHLGNLRIEMLVSNNLRPLLLLIRVALVFNAILLTWNIYHTLILRSISSDDAFGCIWAFFFIRWCCSMTFLPRLLNDHDLLFGIRGRRHLILLLQLQGHTVLFISTLVDVGRWRWMVQKCLCHSCCRLATIVSVKTVFCQLLALPLHRWVLIVTWLSVCRAKVQANRHCVIETWIEICIFLNGSGLEDRSLVHWRLQWVRGLHLGRDWLATISCVSLDLGDTFGLVYRLVSKVIRHIFHHRLDLCKVLRSCKIVIILRRASILGHVKLFLFMELGGDIWCDFDQISLTSGLDLAVVLGTGDILKLCWALNCVD